MNRWPAHLIAKFREFEPKEIGISTIVLSELQSGVSKSQRRQQNEARLEAFLSPFEIAVYDEQAAKAYGEIRAELERTGNLIGREDLLIAAHARSSDSILVTNNEREFLRVPGLSVENWVSG